MTRLLQPAVVALVLVAGASTASAADWYVDSTLGDDANSCMAPGLGTACLTIQAAIVKAVANDTIHVAAGTYPEPASGPLTVDKTLTLLGAQSGVDARTRVGAESIVTDPQGTQVTANGVVIDGFTVQDSLVAAFTGFGIFLNPGIEGTQILNNIIQDNIVGIGLANSGAQALIRHNLIQNNNRPGGAAGTGIYTDQFVGGPVTSNVLVEENAFKGNIDAGIDVSNTDSNGGAFNLDISTNTFDMNGRGLVLFNTHDSTIHDNNITNSTFVGSAAIRLFDNNSNITILDNNVINGFGHAIRLSFSGTVGGPSSGVVIHENNIEVFALDGLLVDLLSHVATVNAECNWWNSPSGPFALSNPGGTGEEVVGDADFTPWLTSPAPGGACVGGVPSTPGKVTGGGQIQGDPVFSPLGDLLSVPALVSSVLSANSNATFGFTVKCCAAAGNLEYNDHDAGVRIKAETIDALFISTPGTSCPTTSGSQHAKFTGTAAVIRAAGTTHESFTVDVDDCGEPGFMDSFSIQTTTYANGPNTLLGGNIQIHK